MKQLLILAISTLMLCSCEEPAKREVITYPHYRYGTDTYIPDSVKMAYADWVTKTVAAASSHMTAGDYEDPEDVIVQAQETGERIFEVKTEGLYRTISEGNWEEFIPKERLTQEEVKILDKLKNVK